MVFAASIIHLYSSKVTKLIFTCYLLFMLGSSDFTLFSIFPGKITRRLCGTCILVQILTIKIYFLQFSFIGTTGSYDSVVTSPRDDISGRVLFPRQRMGRQRYAFLERHSPYAIGMLKDQQHDSHPCAFPVPIRRLRQYALSYFALISFIFQNTFVHCTYLKMTTLSLHRRYHSCSSTRMQVYFPKVQEQGEPIIVCHCCQSN